jgi:hypothetical protein
MIKNNINNFKKQKKMKKTGFSIAYILSGAVMMASGVVVIANTVIDIASGRTKSNDKK